MLLCRRQAQIDLRGMSEWRRQRCERGTFCEFEGCWLGARTCTLALVLVVEVLGALLRQEWAGFCAGGNGGVD